jgi:hypothetical protein
MDRELLVGMVNSPSAWEYITRVLEPLEVTLQMPGEVCGSSVAVEASTSAMKPIVPRGAARWVGAARDVNYLLAISV